MLNKAISGVEWLEMSFAWVITSQTINQAWLGAQLPLSAFGRAWSGAGMGQGGSL